MELVPCRKCGKLFNYITGSQLCPQCVKQADEKFKEVKKYVYDNPSCSINDISKAMEVSVRQIRRWVREERLTFSEDSPIGIECEHCGAIIKTGRFCANCQEKMKKGLMNAAGLNRKKEEELPKPKKEGGNRMRFLDN